MVKSLPAWGVWIEINCCRLPLIIAAASLPAWGVWIEIECLYRLLIRAAASLPAWGVWIEILYYILRNMSIHVAPRMGSVD